jgi:hypothetical protein
LSGAANRQDYLETVIDWIGGSINEMKLDKNRIERYMAKNQNQPNANEIWLYFQNVINWVNVVFPKHRSEMKGVEWGILYNEHKDKQFNSEELEKEITRLMSDDDVTNKKGIYEYVLNNNDKHLNIRVFTPNQKREAYEKQKGICPKCEKHFELSEMEADHITPWSLGGKTNSNNCQMLCKHDNRIKSGK